MHKQSEAVETHAARGDDHTLLQRAASGDTAALGLLYDRYSRLVYSIAFRITGDRGSAEEITQDTFLRLWSYASRYNVERGSVIAWLLAIARRRAIDELRSKASSSRRRESELPDDLPPAETVDFSDLAQLRTDIQQALETLPQAQREAIELMFFGGLSRQEIARRTGNPLGTIHTRLRLAMAKLRALLLDQQQDGPADSA